MHITPDVVDRFVESLGKDRQWLADEVGCSRGTLNNWFSAKQFPLWAQKSISRLIAEHERGRAVDDSVPHFSLPEWQKIQAATNASGAASVQEFVKEALLAASERILQEESRMLGGSPS